MTFLPMLEGLYTVGIVMDGENYKNPIESEITGMKCEGDNPVLCPNKLECVKSI